MIYLKENSEEIQDKIRKAGISICLCAMDAPYLIYMDGDDGLQLVHGEGTPSVVKDEYKDFTPEEILEYDIGEALYFGYGIVECHNVDEFIEYIKAAQHGKNNQED